MEVAGNFAAFIGYQWKLDERIREFELAVEFQRFQIVPGRINELLAAGWLYIQPAILSRPTAGCASPNRNLPQALRERWSCAS